MTTPRVLSLACPAKVNLFLEIRGRRADGFHELGTLFQAVETGDVLHAEPHDVIALAGAEGVTNNPDDNLVMKAARLVKARHASRIPVGAGVRFTLDKRLPSGAGLGGGSSDAAAALRLLDALWNLNLSATQLQGLGAELGSDVPFFLSSATAYGEGRGEALSPAPAPFPFHVVIATPDSHVDTAGAYRDLARFRTEKLQGKFGTLWEGFRREYQEQAASPAFYARLHNDFEAPVMDAYPDIATARDTLASFAPRKTMLSGSGASVFALFEDEAAAGRACAAVAGRCRFAVVTRFLTALPAPSA